MGQKHNFSIHRVFTPCMNESKSIIGKKCYFGSSIEELERLVRIDGQKGRVYSISRSGYFIDYDGLERNFAYLIDTTN